MGNLRIRRLRLATLVALLALTPPASALRAQDGATPDEPSAPSARQAPPQGAGDSTVVDFFLPGHFAEALAAAKARKRLLLVKGVAFGMDDEGAGCATKGYW